MSVKSLDQLNGARWACVVEKQSDSMLQGHPVAQQKKEHRTV